MGNISLELTSAMSRQVIIADSPTERSLLVKCLDILLATVRYKS
jgi:hypothetical protein